MRAGFLGVMKLETELYDKDDNLIFVTGELTRGQRGLRGYYGHPETPDDDDEVSIISAVDEDDNEVELTEAQEEEATNNFYSEGY